MPTGIKIVSEANLGRSSGPAEKYKEVLVCTSLEEAFTPTNTTSMANSIMMLGGGGGDSEYTGGFVHQPAGLTLVAGDGGTTRTFINLDSKAWQGGMTTVVSPASHHDSSDQPLFAEIQQGLEMADDPLEGNSREMETRTPGGSSSSSSGGGRGGRRGGIIKEEENLSPEEEERRRVRRERNKLAAARCRKRRVDQTESLQHQVDEWEEKKRALQEEISFLTSQKEELQFLLEAHNTVCSRSRSVVAAGGGAPATAAKSSGTTISLVRQNNYSPSTTITASRSRHVELTVPKVIVKSEPVGLEYSTRHLTHEEALQTASNTHSDGAGSQSTNVTASINNNNNITVGQQQQQRAKRPASLAFGGKSNMMRFIEGIPIETPTNVVPTLNFDALMDGRTGLTPTNILTPVNMNFVVGCSSINTPTVNTPTSGGLGAGCGSQQRGLGDMGSPDNGSPKLVSL